MFGSQWWLCLVFSSLQMSKKQTKSMITTCFNTVSSMLWILAWGDAIQNIWQVDNYVSPSKVLGFLASHQMNPLWLDITVWYNSFSSVWRWVVCFNVISLVLLDEFAEIFFPLWSNTKYFYVFLRRRVCITITAQYKQQTLLSWQVKIILVSILQYAVSQLFEASFFYRTDFRYRWLKHCGKCWYCPNNTLV